MNDEIDWIERSSSTFEVIAKHKSSLGPHRRVVYRFWQLEDEDWKLQIIDSEDPELAGPFLIPKKVIDTIIKATVKGELKK